MRIAKVAVFLTAMILILSSGCGALPGWQNAGEVSACVYVNPANTTTITTNKLSVINVAGNVVNYFPKGTTVYLNPANTRVAAKGQFGSWKVTNRWN
jgi:hypothetical protein